MNESRSCMQANVLQDIQEKINTRVPIDPIFGCIVQCHVAALLCLSQGWQCIYAHNNQRHWLHHWIPVPPILHDLRNQNCQGIVSHESIPTMLIILTNNKVNLIADLHNKAANLVQHWGVGIDSTPHVPTPKELWSAAYHRWMDLCCFLCLCFCGSS